MQLDLKLQFRTSFAQIGLLTEVEKSLKILLLSISLSFNDEVKQYIPDTHVLPVKCVTLRLTSFVFFMQ